LVQTSLYEVQLLAGMDVAEATMQDHTQCAPQLALKREDEDKEKGHRVKYHTPTVYIYQVNIHTI